MVTKNTSQLDVLLTLNDKATAGIRKSFGGIQNDVRKTETRFKRAFDGMTRLAIRFGLAIGAFGVALAFKKVIDVAIEFESAFAGVRKTVEATEEEFAQLSKALIEMSKVIPVAASELAGIQEIAGQLGVRGVKNLTKFTETVAKIAVTTNLTREAAATNFARIANIMQIPLRNVDRMGAAIVDLGNNFATTEAEISEFANRIAGAGRVAGLTVSDIFAFGAAFSSVGVKAERGGTAVSKALILMGTSVVEGGDKLKQFADISGLTSQEFIEAYEENAGKAFALFIDGLGRKGLKGKQILQDLGLGNERLVQAFLSVGGASGILARALDLSNDAFEENNALNEEAAKRFETTASQITIFKNNLAALGIEIGTRTLPLLNRLLKALIPNEVNRSTAAFKRQIDVLSDNRENYNLVIEAQQQLNKELAEGGIRIDGTSVFMERFGGQLSFANGKVSGLDEALKFFGITLDEINSIGLGGALGSILGEEEAEPETPKFITKQLEGIVQLREAWATFNDERFTQGMINLQRETEFVRLGLDTQLKAHQSMWVAVGQLRDTFSKGLSKSIVSAIKGTTSLKESFKELGFQMLQVLIDFAVQKVVNAALSKVIMTEQVAAALVAGAATAQAWAPAAALASLASFGANAVPAAAGIISVSALARSLAIPGLAEGGIVNRPTLALIGERGREAVVPLDDDNAINPITVNINVEANVSQETDISALAEELGFLIEPEISRARTIG